MTLFDRIKKLRKEKNITQEELAKKVGYKSRSTINKIEFGLRDISQSQIILFANAFSVTPAYLMGWEDEPEATFEFYERIKQLRIELGLSQIELAEKVGYKDRTSIAKVESGKIDLPQSKIIDFAKALNVTPTYLMGWKYESSEDIKTSAAYNCDDKSSLLMSDFALNLRQLRLKKNLTQTDLSQLLSVSKSTISMYENGNREPDLKTLKSIADLFNVNIDFLLRKSNKDIQTIATHYETEDWTKEELIEIESFKQFVKSKRNE